MKLTDNVQRGPDLRELELLVAELWWYEPKWTFELQNMDRGQGCSGPTLVIRPHKSNTYPPYTENMPTAHLFPVPAAAYNRQSWMRWLFDRIGDVELHERCEGFRLKLADGTILRPFAPAHPPGYDPYIVHDLGTPEADT